MITTLASNKLLKNIVDYLLNRVSNENFYQQEDKPKIGFMIKKFEKNTKDFLRNTTYKINKVNGLMYLSHLLYSVKKLLIELLIFD